MLLALGLLALLSAGPAWDGAAFVGLGVALLLTLAGATASRAYGDARAGAALGGYALPYAFAGGALLVAPADRVGVLGPAALAGRLRAAGRLGGAAAGRRARRGRRGRRRCGSSRPVRRSACWVRSPPWSALLTSAAGAAAVLLSVLVCGIGRCRCWRSGSARCRRRR